MSVTSSWEEETMREQEGEDATKEYSHSDGYADCNPRFGERMRRVSHPISPANHLWGHSKELWVHERGLRERKVSGNG